MQLEVLAQEAQQRAAALADSMQKQQQEPGFLPRPEPVMRGRSMTMPSRLSATAVGPSSPNEAPLPTSAMPGASSTPGGGISTTVGLSPVANLPSASPKAL